MTETLVSICAGIALSAACGFRIFIPLLVMSLAGRSGHLDVGTGFQWLTTYPAMIVFATATVAEIAAYYIPWVDNVLDTIATPTAIIAGALTTAAVLPEMSPMLKWVMAAILGGGTAGLVQGSTVLARGTSSVTTGGIGNPLVATAEAGSSVTVSLLALILPVVAGLLVLGLLFILVRKMIRLRRENQPTAIPAV